MKLTLTNAIIGSCRWQARNSMGYALYYLVQLNVQGSVYMKDAWHRVSVNTGGRVLEPEGGISCSAEGVAAFHC